MTQKGIVSYEREIRGKWIVKDGKVRVDKNCHRIESLIANHLRSMGHDTSGWNQLYLDPDDGRYWELTYPESELHGGGPPCLVCISEVDVKVKYGHLIW